MAAPDFSADLAAHAETVARLRDVDSPKAREEVTGSLWETGCMLQLSGDLVASRAAFDELLRLADEHVDEPALFEVVEDVLLVRRRNARDAGRADEVQNLDGLLVEHRATWARRPEDSRSVAELYMAAGEKSDGGEPAEALALLARGLRPYEDADVRPSVEDLPWVVKCFAFLGSLAEHHQQPEGARAAYDEALRLSTTSEDPEVKSTAEWTERRRAGLPPALQ